MAEPVGQLEYRMAQQVGVSFPDRTIELVVMPYETEALVAIRGRMVREIVARGAFDGIERRANRVRVNRDHDMARIIGRAVAVHPSREEGLVAELRIAKTELGDETLALADDDCLDASAGFVPMQGGESWPERNLRRLSKLWLGEIAMTPDPAYSGTHVLAVRSQQEPGERLETPNLDVVHGWALEDAYDRLTRYAAD